MKILEKALGFDPSKHSFRTELIAGATTFLTMSYILAVNPSILADSGMPFLLILFVKQWVIHGNNRLQLCLLKVLSLLLSPSLTFEN